MLSALKGHIAFCIQCTLQIKFLCSQLIVSIAIETIHNFACGIAKSAFTVQLNHDCHLWQLNIVAYETWCFLFREVSTFFVPLTQVTTLQNKQHVAFLTNFLRELLRGM